MVKKHKFNKTEKETDRAREELKGLEDLPLVGGLLKGLGKFIDLVEEVEEAGGEIKKRGEIKDAEGKLRGIYGFSIGTDIGGRPKIQTFGNIKTVKEKERAKPEFKITETREPIVDVFDEKDHILVVAELPGINEKEIKTSLKGDILILEAGDEPSFASAFAKASADKKASEGKGKGKYYKEVLLPSKVNAETEERTYKNGILEIKFKKA